MKLLGSLDDVRRSANLSDCGQYRWSLHRTWGARPALTFVMLNPSTADATIDDPTIRRCIGFAKREGFGGIRVVNLYSFRATKPADLWKADDPIGSLTDDILREVLREGHVVAAWGVNAQPERVAWLLRQPFAEGVSCLGRTKGGQPRHPLYVRGDAPLVPFATPTTPDAPASTTKD